MSTSPSSSVQKAREAIAAHLREMRLDAGLTVEALAGRCGWNKSKSSRIENTRTLPSDADIRAWCAACDAEDKAADLVAASRSADSMYVEWRRLQRTGLRRGQEGRVPLYERTRLFRIYCANVIPGLLQTETYATALLSAITDFRGTPNDVTDAVAARLARSRVIHQGNRRFGLLIEEEVLRHRMGSAATTRGQLEYLLTIMSLPRVSLGVIPFTADRHMWPVETFSIFDENQVSVELVSAAITVTAPSEIALYAKAHAELQKLAVYGPQARALIRAAVHALE
ncbi:XRE family transcriptional regulator [Streptomyces eurocidicus]|uniref:Transcriptional regulator with XRE-family HTH domain n=1 Tax=Streptomyces eurocidicus TaxID=66423 RepID=A0A2N8P394_STREU|nr:helix-turn-helix transcriptional regulator [Streptomyces eurocidicus]MBB5117679.1 transcriptional regulator with XRE-family HTH domain [Streptomyces eurocidicus]MBF6053516.1 helix-turn-helix domain-containing protein [Streptomyces eurocidicus]PNE35488.1 XRE family transcriptional regulator [Streptomyces eurocidicus]